LGILRNTRAKIAVTVNERFINDSQKRKFLQEVAVVCFADPNITAAAFLIEFLVNSPTCRPLNEDPGRFLFILVDILVDSQAPAADTIALRQAIGPAAPE
jgi:hypothetical protein